MKLICTIFMFLGAMASGALIVVGVNIAIGQNNTIMCVPSFGLALCSLLFSGILKASSECLK